MKAEYCQLRFVTKAANAITALSPLSAMRIVSIPYRPRVMGKRWATLARSAIPINGRTSSHVRVGLNGERRSSTSFRVSGSTDLLVALSNALVQLREILL